MENVGYNPSIRIDRLDEHSLQEIFDFAVNYLRKQRVRAYDGDNCLYFDPFTGNRCAVGCFIPSELYKKSFEGMDYGGVLDRLGLDYRKDVEKLLDYLQKIHDSNEYCGLWERGFKSVAEAFGLEYTSPSDPS